MKKLLLSLSLLVAFVSGACDDAGPLDPETPPFAAERAGPAALGIMTWNVYVGADLTQLLAVEDPSQIACGVAAVYGDVLATDFSARAVAIADQIEAFAPDVIGLNEVSTFDFIYETIHNDLVFLDILMAELDSRGLEYEAPVAARSTNFEIALPISYAANCDPQDLLAYTEYDVLLVQGDVVRTGADNGRYGQPLPLPFGLNPKYSGWASVDIEHQALPYRVFTTHLEPADTGPCATDDDGLLFVHNAQAGELMEIVNDEAWTYPVILTGDLNSDASGCTTETYPSLIDDGFVDAWTLGRPLGNGYTSNQDADLLNETSKLWHRIDFILYRDAFTQASGRFQGSAHADRVGEEQADRVETAFGDVVWPSDHAGVVADLGIAPGLGHPQ